MAEKLSILVDLQNRSSPAFTFKGKWSAHRAFCWLVSGDHAGPPFHRRNSGVYLSLEQYPPVIPKRYRYLILHANHPQHDPPKGECCAGHSSGATLVHLTRRG